MNTKFLKAVTAIAFAIVASSPLTHAAAVSPSEFNTELKAKIGKKKGISAANAAAKYFGSVLKDKLNKKNAEKYAKSVITALKKPVPLTGPFSGPAVNASLKQLLTGYFTKKAFNINDPTYNKALYALFKGLAPSARTAAVSQTLYNSIKQFAVKKSSTQDQVYTYYQAVGTRFNLPPPPMS